MAKVLLGVTGSVAAIRTPALYSALVQAGHEVKVVATQAALYFFNSTELPPEVLHLDADEWPRQAKGGHYQREDAVLHIELRRWADLLLIAPLDANTLAKLAYGICDNCLTCVWRAWDWGRPAILAPAMNTFMWDSPQTRRHLRLLIEDFGRPMATHDLDELVANLNESCRSLSMVAPQSKRLACGDVGIGGMAEVSALVSAVNERIAFSSDAPKSSP